MYDFKNKVDRKKSLLNFLMQKYLPFWPLFVGLLVIFLFFTWIYLQYATPIYEVSATLLINDENKGVEDSDLMKSINAFDTKKIVENEIEVIHSKDLMRGVVDDLYLYAPIFEKSGLFSTSAYTISPISVRMKNPDRIPVNPIKRFKEGFSYNPLKEEVILNGSAVSLNIWVEQPYGEIMFFKNGNHKRSDTQSFYFTLINPKAVTEDLLKEFDVNAPNKVSTVVQLVLEDPVPKRGKDILNHLITLYNKKTLKSRDSLATNTLSFIEQRISKVEGELNALETEIQKYKSNEGAVDLREQSKLYLEDLGESDRKIAEINIQLDVLDNVEDYVISKGATGGIVPSTAGVDNPVLSQLLEKIYNAEVDYERLSKTTAENNPILVSIKSEINKIRPSILENVRSQRANLEAKLKNLNLTNKKFSSSLRDIPEQERNLLEINRRKAIKSELFSFLLQKREETALSYVPTDGDIRMVDSAEASVLPVRPRPLLYYFGAFILAFGLGMVYVSGKETLSSKVLFRSEIEDYTNVPVITELSYMKENANGMIIKPEKPIVIEQFRQLGAKLGLYRRHLGYKRILITSSVAGEGKSYVSTNLAYILAESGKKVCLLDMDFRKPYVSQLFDLSESSGIVDFLRAEVDLKGILHPSTLSDDLFIVPAGTRGSDQTKLLLNGKLNLLINEISEDFDYLIFDSAPVEAVSDTNLLMDFADRTLLVIRHAHTPKHVLRHLNDSTKAEALGDVAIVFNGLKERGLMKVDHGYGYGYTYPHTRGAGY